MKFLSAVGILRAAQSGGSLGALFGMAVAAVTSFQNRLAHPRDSMVLLLYLAATFALLFAAAAALGAATRWCLRRFQKGHRTPSLNEHHDRGLADAVTCFGALWMLRWFEFNLAYPTSLTFQPDFLKMSLLAIAFAFAALGASLLLGQSIFRALSFLRDHGAVPGRRTLAMLSATFVVVTIALGFIAGETERRMFLTRSSDPPVVPASAPTASRVLLLGCDGADPRLFRQLLEEGALPHLSRLTARGVVSPLKSIPGRASPSIWTSLATGCSPRAHGIEDFYVQTPRGMLQSVARFPEYLGLNHGLLLRDLWTDRLVRVEPVHSGLIRRMPVWEILVEQEISCAVVNWLVTWPAQTSRAPLVSDRAHWRTREMGLELGLNDATLWTPGILTPEVAQAVRDSLPAAEDAFMGELARRAAHALNPRFLAATFRDVDAAEHLEWDTFEPQYFGGAAPADSSPLGHPIPRAYIRFDAVAGDLIEWAGPEAIVFLVSDHGHGPWYTWLGRGTPGGHTNSPPGILVAAGPGIRRGTLATPPSCFDVAPTILHVFGLPVPQDMEGRVISDLFEARSPGARPPRLIASYERREVWNAGRLDFAARESAGEVLGDSTSAPNETMNAEIFERLEALGYVR